MKNLQESANQILDFTFTDKVEVIDNPATSNEKFSKIIYNETQARALYYGNEKTKIISPVMFAFVAKELSKKKIEYEQKIYKLNENSWQSIFTIVSNDRNTQVGDVCEAAIIVNSSLDMVHENGFETCISRLVCSNGLKRKEQHHVYNPEIISLAIAELRVSQEWIQMMKDKKTAWVVVQSKKFMENFIDATSFPKKLVENGHEYLAIEAERAGELNNWLVYNAFNKAIFEETDSDMPYRRKKIIDGKIFDLILQ